MSIRATHTYAVMYVSKRTYEEIRRKLVSAEYSHAIMEDGTLDMHGIAVATTKRSMLNERKSST